MFILNFKNDHLLQVDLTEVLVTQDTEWERLQQEMGRRRLAANRDEVCQDKLKLEINLQCNEGG